jgi:hypothetical protein
MDTFYTQRSLFRKLLALAIVSIALSNMQGYDGVFLDIFDGETLNG